VSRLLWYRQFDDRVLALDRVVDRHLNDWVASLDRQPCCLRLLIGRKRILRLSIDLKECVLLLYGHGSLRIVLTLEKKFALLF